jgi:putative inorganic carbon (hco3(-)) transporter
LNHVKKINKTAKVLTLKKQNVKWLYIFSALFIALNSVCIAFEFYWMSLLPVIIIIALLAFLSLDKLVLLIVFFTPLSLTVEVADSGAAINLPTEPLLFGVLIVFVFKLIYQNNFDKRVFSHPITLAILFSVLWMFITSFTSSMPVVSFKYLLARIWFLVSFYFIAVQMFKDSVNITRYLWVYMLSFTLVIIYTIVIHAQDGFSEQLAHYAMTPFYKDHTSYGAMLAMFIPVLIAYVNDRNNTPFIKSSALLLLILFILAVVLSYTRAAWLGLVIILCMFIVYKFKIKLKVLVLGALGLTLIFFSFRQQIIQKIQKNKQASSKNFAEHVQSISNVSNDASNLERINRWHSALRMYKEKPFFGWGPGTYMFNYASFQFSAEKTIISTNAGDAGNAHSEYIGPLAESGVFGALSVLLIVAAFVYTGNNLYRTVTNKAVRNLSLALTLGLITYFIHGLLNNFLDTDKACAPVWGAMAALVAIDLYHRRRLQKPTTK